MEQLSLIISNANHEEMTLADSVDIILKSAIVMFEIRSYKTSMEAFILADRFQNNIEVSTTICILKFVQISVYGT